MATNKKIKAKTAPKKTVKPTGKATKPAVKAKNTTSKKVVAKPSKTNIRQCTNIHWGVITGADRTATARIPVPGGSPLPRAKAFTSTAQAAKGNFETLWSLRSESNPNQPRMS